LEFTIEKLVYGGDGLARLPADEHGSGKAVFMPFVLEGERVEATISEQRPGFARARLEQVTEPSPHRVDPGCPYFGQCGGCHYQHASYEHQLQIKAAILVETLRRITKIELQSGLHLHPSEPWQYRNRTRMRLAWPAPAVTGEFTMGYRRFASHEVLAVEQCPISSPRINRAIAALWELGRSGKLPREIIEVEFFANAADDQLLLELSVSDQDWRRKKPSLVEAVTALRDQMPEVAGVAVFQADGRGQPVREQIPPEMRSAFGAGSVEYKTKAASYRVSAGAFFQTNRSLTDELVGIVTNGRQGGRALDLYAGTGLFSVPLAKGFDEVTAVEAEPMSFGDLQQNGRRVLRTFRKTTEQYLSADTSKFDFVVVDPPRGGLGSKVVNALAGRKPPRITYVSCDPATLARDLAGLIAAGYGIEEAHLVDLFPQTFHIESVLQLVR
jgi:23S rRNA (uracil1939-C5)-methyltransferase